MPKSSDKESGFDENFFKQEADDSELHETLHGEPNDKLLEKEDEALTSEDEQSDNGDAKADEPVVNRQFHRQYKKYAVSSIVDALLAWATFIDQNIIQMIIRYTNQSINESIRHSKQNKESDKLCHLTETNERQIKAFIGFWYSRGLFDWKFHDVTTCFSPMGIRFSMQQC